MATLRSYLEARPKAKFAASVGITPPYLSQLLSGKRLPSRDLMVRIQEVTGGEVDLNSWTFMQASASAHGKRNAPRKGRRA